ncbi:MAG: roadblock/LC7 domain-containing protein [Candidatus Njordarchaeia archaeon]
MEIDEGVANSVVELIEKGMCVYEITRELRVAGFSVSLDDVIDIVESLRKQGYLRAVGLKNPDDFERAEIVALIPSIEEEEPIEEEKIEEVLGPAVAELKSDIEEIFKEEPAPAALEAIEEKPVTPFQEVDKGLEPVEIVRIGEIVSEKIKFDLESLLALNEHIQNILISTKDGLPILQVTRKNMAKIDEARIAAAVSVVMAMSSRTTADMGKKSLDNVIIKTDQSLFILGYIDSSYILTFLLDIKAPMGLMMADFNGLRRKIAKLIEEAHEA